MTFKSFETFLGNVVEFWSTLKCFFHTCSCLLSHPCSIPLFKGMIFLKNIYKITVRTLKPGHLEQDVQSQRFLKTNSQDSQVFFCKETNEIQGSTIQPLKTGNCPQISECYLSVCQKKYCESFVFRKRYDWTLFFKVSRFECPHCQWNAKPTFFMITGFDNSRPFEWSLVLFYWNRVDCRL